MNLFQFGQALMNAHAYSLNRFLAAACPSATYKVIDRVAARRAKGASIISLSAGEPDLDTPEHVREAGITAIRAGHSRIAHGRSH